MSDTPEHTPEQIAMMAMQSEAMMWLMAGSGHVDLQLKALRRYWRAYLDAGGPTWAKPEKVAQRGSQGREEAL